MSRLFLLVLVSGLGLGLALWNAAWSDDFEQAPINYTNATPDNCVSRLQAKLESGQVRLEYDDNHGYLKSVLKALNVPVSSQVLVFSKTSLQRHRIAPKTPRALYFNDDVYIGFCWRGDVMEISAVDPDLGTVYYTLPQEPADQPRFVRQTDNCLICHGSTLTRGYPGHMVRSVFPDRDGQPMLSLGTTRVDQSTPLQSRWGGWYVTGTSGKQLHRGNIVLKGHPSDIPIDYEKAVNCTDLKSLFTVANYLSPHSDIVSLMVLEHQVEMHNRITQANFETRRALHQQEEFDRILQRKAEGPSESTARRIKSACEPLVQYMLFCRELKLTDKITGTSNFTEEFAARGPKDKQGRSLREFDLERRMFRYPCSYLIYSAAFDRLPAEAKEYIYGRLWEILWEVDRSAEFDHLSSADRLAIREILLDTRQDLPDNWRQAR